MFENEVHMEFLSLSQNEAFARMVVSAFASQLNPTIEQLTDIRTAVSEAVTNCIIHGYGNDPHCWVYLSCKLTGREIEVTVRDTGKGIEDVALAMQPFYTSMPDLERSGMGFAVMQAFMDNVEVESEVGSGTTVKLRKSIPEVLDE
jgi:stage II sporulation protein AB (anti-sigma F factor)